MIDFFQRIGAAIQQGLDTHVVPLLKTVLRPLDAWLDSAPPWMGQACAVSLFVLAGLWLLTLKREYIFQGAPDESRWRDLRIWAWLALIPFIALYVFFR